MSENKIFCSNCGKQINENVQFCPYCGQKNDFQSINWPDEPDRKAKKKEEHQEQNTAILSNMTKILIGVCAVLAVIVVVLLVSGFTSGKSEKTEEAETAAESTKEAEEAETEEIEVKDSNEPNNSAAEAVVLKDGQSVTGYIDSKDDIDYFVISTEKKATAKVTFSHATSAEQGGLGWKVNYSDAGTTRTDLSWLSEEEKTIKFDLQEGDNFIFITGDSEASHEIEETVRETPYYLTVDSIKTKKEEKAEESSEESKIIIINPYDGKEHYISGSGYVIPYSSQYRLTYSDISGLSSAELRLARNEIYARHGRRFKDSSLQAYFDAQSWYYGTIDPGDFKESYLSSIERDNVAFIKSYE